MFIVVNIANLFFSRWSRKELKELMDLHVSSDQSLLVFLWIIGMFCVQMFLNYRARRFFDENLSIKNWVAVLSSYQELFVIDDLKSIFIG